MSKRTVFYTSNNIAQAVLEEAESWGAQNPGRKPRRWYDPQGGREEACRKAGHTLTMNFCKECDRFV